MRRMYAISSLFAILTLGLVGAAQQNSGPKDKPQPAKEKPKPAPMKDPTLEGIAGELTYTTYFYTASEAVIHGFEADTKVRIISMDQKGTVFEGKVGKMETKVVPTGKGVFSFVSNKKASILVGTPTSCAAVGYWVRDQDGNFRAKELFAMTPQAHAHSADCRIVVWAWEDVKVDIADVTTKKTIATGVAIKAG